MSATKLEGYNAVRHTYVFLNREGETQVADELSCIDCLHESNNHEDDNTWIMEFDEIEWTGDPEEREACTCDYCGEVIE